MSDYALALALLALNEQQPRGVEPLGLLVSERRLELPRAIRPLGPQPSASTNSATPTWEPGVYREADAFGHAGNASDDVLDLGEMTRNPVTGFELRELRFVHIALPLLGDGTPCVEAASGRRIRW